MAAAFGEKYGPAITAAGAAMTGLGAAIEVTSAVTTALKDSTLLQAVASQVATAAQWLWNAAMDANPIMIVVLALAALVAGLVWAYQNVDWFRSIVDTTFNWIKDNWPLLVAILTGPFGVAVLLIVDNWTTISNAISGVYDWIVGNWPLLLAILTGPFGLAALAIIDNWQTIKDAATDVYNWVADKFNAIAGAILAVVDAVSSAISSVADAIKAPINAVIRAFNGIEFRIPSFTLPSFDIGPVHLGGETVGGTTIGFPDIPQLAQGGLITSTGLVYAHAGEVISPTPAGIGGPAVHIEQATFVDPVDIDVLMQRVAWAVRSSAA
jgi:phage-related protein